MLIPDCTKPDIRASFNPLSCAEIEDSNKDFHSVGSKVGVLVAAAGSTTGMVFRSKIILSY